MANTINININKTDLGLNNVDNTSDLNKPISTATQTALNGKEDVANKENITLDTSSTKYPTNNLVKTNLDLKDSITTSQTATLQFRFDKKHIHATTGVGGALAPLTGNITLFAGTNRVNVTSVMLHNDSVEPTFSSEFERSADSLPYITGQDNIIVATMYNQNPTKVTYKILRSGSNIYSSFLTTSLKGAVNGLAELDGSGKVPSGQLPSYVDDVVEVANFASLPGTGESGKIYITLDNNLTFRWSGSAYVEISASLALGELSTTAYRGDRGATAYTHSQLTSGNPHNVTKSDVGLSNVVNSDTTTTANITDSSNKRFVTDSEKTKLSNTSGTNTGNETTSSIGALINGSTTATPNDTDLVATSESSLLKKITWSSVKSFLKTYFDTIYTTTSSVASQITTALSGYATQSWVSSQGYITSVITSLGYTPLNKAGDTISGDIGNTSTGFFRIPSGTTAQRPVTPLEGMRRYNTTTSRDEFYANGSWQNHARLSGDTFTGAISATNLSGTNTGDQDLSSLATKNVTLDRKVASYVLQASDNNKLIEMNVGSGNSVTINNSIFSAGNQILVSQYGAGQVTFVAGSGVTLRSASGKLKLTGQYSMATIVAISSSEFYIAGDLTA
jgi:hypothetical protein